MDLNYDPHTTRSLRLIPSKLVPRLVSEEDCIRIEA